MSNIKTMDGTRAVNRLSNLLKHGRRQMEHYSKVSNIQDEVGITYYCLAGSKRIVTFREWHQMDRPDYLVSGSKSAVTNYRKSITARK